MMSQIPVFFIPALLCDEALYSQVIEIMKNRVSVEVMMSPKAELADSCADILARAPEKFVLVGTSYGGNLALEIALAASERIKGLWAMGCDPGPPSAGTADLASGLEATPAAVIDMLSGLVVRKTDTGSATVFREMAHWVGGNAGAAQARALSTRSDRTGRLQELAMPVLLTWGADDALVPPSVREMMAQKFPSATLHGLSDCGHLPTLEQPQQAAALFSAFLEKLAVE